MTYQDHFTLPTELLEQVAEQGLDFLPELIRVVVNTAMEAEREHHLGVGPYERSTKRRGRLTASNLRRLQPGWHRSLLMCPRCEKEVSTPRPWRKACAVNEL